MSISSGHDLDRPTPTTASDATPHVAAGSDSIDPIELYAAGVDTSDYVARVAPLIRQGVGEIGDLLDIGAGGGQLGRALRVPDRRWTAIEPSAGMRARLDTAFGVSFERLDTPHHRLLLPTLSR